ncbi:hypothetical protein ACOME3_009971 [Neoechinorhynchus agilis]
MGTSSQLAEVLVVQRDTVIVFDIPTDVSLSKFAVWTSSLFGPIVAIAERHAEDLRKKRDAIIIRFYDERQVALMILAFTAISKPSRLFKCYPISLCATKYCPKFLDYIINNEDGAKCEDRGCMFVHGHRNIFYHVTLGKSFSQKLAQITNNVIKMNTLEWERSQFKNMTTVFVSDFFYAFVSEYSDILHEMARIYDPTNVFDAVNHTEGDEQHWRLKSSWNFV